MSRRAQPYTVATGIDTPHIAPVGTPPTMATRHIRGFGAMIGLITRGTKRGVVPIDDPYAGQGATFPQFPYYLPSDVAPDAITPALFVAMNNFSPAGHSNVLSNVIPAMAESPTVIRRPPQTQSGRPSGVYTIPHPPAGVWWPSSAMWLSQRMAANVPQQPASGWVSQRTPPA